VKPSWRVLLPSLALLLAISAGLSFALVTGPATPALPGGAQQAAPASGYDGMLALPVRAAPAIDLRNFRGRRVTLAQYRGKAVLVTFLYTHCPDVCPLITANLGVALKMLGRLASQVQVLAVSVDPRGDTPAAVAGFLRRHGMTDRMQYLTGSAGELARAWVAWGVGAKAQVGRPDLVAHSALVYGVSARGRLTTIYPPSFEPRQIAHDVSRLAAH